MSMCRIFSCVVGRRCLLWPVHFLGKTLLVFSLLHSTFQGQICLLLQVFLDFLLLYIVIINNATMNMRVNISFFFLSHIFESSHSIVLMSQVMIQLETNRDHSVIFETASKYWILDSFVDYDGYSISSKGFLPAVRIPLYSICLYCCDFEGLHQTTTHLLDSLLTLHGLRCYTRTPLTMWVLILHPPNDFWTEVFRKRRDVMGCGREERGKEREGKRKRTLLLG